MVVWHQRIVDIISGWKNKYFENNKNSNSKFLFSMGGCEPQAGDSKEVEGRKLANEYFKTNK